MISNHHTPSHALYSFIFVELFFIIIDYTKSFHTICVLFTIATISCDSQ